MKEKPNIIENLHIIDNSQNVVVDMNVITELIKQNEEFKTFITDQQKQMQQMGSSSIIHNTSNNYNLNVFLNEKCKDALNLVDFVNSINVQLNEIENIGHKGYVKGISDIITTRIKQMDVYKRPLHCTDAKRKIIYVKENDAWSNVNGEQRLIDGAIKPVMVKNWRKVGEWEVEHPQSIVNGTDENEFRTTLMLHSLGAAEKDEQEKMDGKVLAEIVRSVCIDKTDIKNSIQD